MFDAVPEHVFADILRKLFLKTPQTRDVCMVMVIIHLYSGVFDSVGVP
jgi:hypothetical protein